MLKATYWIKVLSAPLLLVSAGCALGPRPFTTAKRNIPPSRLMAMAKTYERQGHFSQAKNAYRQILASQPDYPDARENLETLIAYEEHPEKWKKSAHPFDQRPQVIAKTKSAPGTPSQKLKAVQEDQPSTLAKSDFPTSETKAKQEPSETSTDLTPAAHIADSLDAAIASREQAEHRTVRPSEWTSKPLSRRPIERPLKVTPIAQIDPILTPPPDSKSETEDPEISNETPIVRNGATSSAVPESPAPVSREIESSEGEFLAITLSSAPPADPIAIDALDDDDDGEDLMDSTPQHAIADIAAAPPETASSDSAESLDSNEKPDLSAGLDWRTAPEPSTKLDAVATVPPTSDAPAETTQFEQPIVRHQETMDRSLEAFFGPFHTGMVKRVRANREQFQSKLLILAADQDVDSDMRSRAVFLLGSIGPAAVDVLPALRREMHYDVDEFLRVDLCEAILKIQPEDEDAIRILVDSLKEPDENLRWIAAYALRNAVSPRTTFVIDSLRDCLTTQDQKLRRMIFLTLAEFGPAAQAAIPDLEAALESPDPATREVAKASLACIAPDRKSTRMIKKTGHRTELTANK